MLKPRCQIWCQVISLFFYNLFDLGCDQLPDPLPVKYQAIIRGQKNQFGGMQGRGHFERNQIGIDSKGSAFSIESKRRNHRNNLLSEKKLKDTGIDLFN